MSTDPELNDNPNGEDTSLPGIVWLVAAFIPAAVGLSLGVTRLGRGAGAAFLVALVLNLVLSVMSARGLARKLKNGGAQIIVGFLLFCFFFIVNIGVVVFAICSQIHF